MQIIVYSTGPVGCAVVTPAPGQDIEAVAERDVPAGVASLIIDDTALPVGAPPLAWKLAGGKITVDADTAAELAKPLVPQSVSRAQAKIALLRSGNLDKVKAAVATNDEAQIWFDDAQNWERQNPYVIDLGEKLLGGSDEIDALFISAGQIQA
jgi:hypothetical protein